jgi:hypothetical protein
MRATRTGADEGAATLNCPLAHDQVFSGEPFFRTDLIEDRVRADGEGTIR